MPSLLESPIDLSRLSRQDKEALVGVYAEKARRHFLDFCHYTDRNYQSPAHIQHLISKLEAVERGEIKRLMIFMPPRHGKQCADSTPVITTKGWTTHGNLKVGDYVFHPSGKPVRILYVSEKTIADIEIEFFNGAKIRCHRNHEWTVFDRGCNKWKTYETNYFIKQNKFGNKKKIVSGNRARYQLPLCEALEFGEKELIIPPYVLGAWLGDGTSTAPAITGDAKDFQIIDAIKKHYAVSSVNIHKTTGCLTTRFGSGSTRASIFGDALRSLGVFANKHIPDIYKFSSIGQRLELLAGIIDTDGYVDKHSRVKIVTASKTLADDIKEVIVSLGWRVYAQKQKPTLSTSGIQGKKPVYYICFNPDKEIPVQLPRKKIKRFPIKRMIGIKNIKEVAGEPGHCITVDSPDGLYLVGRELVPTHNSETVSRKFPAWYLGRNPDHNVILSSYAYSLAKGFSKDNRDMIEGRIYQTVFPISTKDDSRAVNDWDIAGYRGGMLAAGVCGSVTGYGANCMPLGTLVDTIDGKKKIEDCGTGDLVLSYNHDKNKLEYQPVIANLRRTVKGFTKITTVKGDSLTASDDHPVFIPGEGYIKIQYLKEGQNVRIAKTAKDSNHEVLFLRERIPEGLVCLSEMASEKRAEGLLLFKRMLPRASCHQEQKKMLNLWKSCFKENHEILLSNLQAIIAEIKEYSLWILQKAIPSAKQVYKILFFNVQEQLSFACDEGEAESQLSAREGVGGISQRVSEDKETNKRKGWLSLFNLRSHNESLHTPQGLQSSKQYCREFNNSMFHLSHDTPFVKDYPLSSIDSLNVEQEVIDLQIAKNQNFFANSFLVHNCFIIDDPFKNQQEAESPLIRENVWQWYRSVVLTRLEPAAGLILIMTRWHRNDLAGRILDEDKDWDIVNFPALAETNDVLGRKEGSALWPGRFSKPELLVTKDKVGSRVWNALYQQHPMDAESQKFRREWFQWYDSLPVAIKRKGSGIDTATSLKSSNDNTALVDVCRGDDNFLYVDDCFCEKITVSGFAKHLIDKQRLNGYDKVHLEKNNAGEAFKQRIDEISREERVAVPVECVQTTTDKMVRAMEFQPFVENGTLRFKRSNKKVAELVEHLINFDGNGGDVDDDVDALGFAVKAALGEGDIFIGTSDRDVSPD